MKIALDISVLNNKNKTGIGVYTYELVSHYLKIDKSNEIILFGFATFSTTSYLKNIFKENNRVKVRVFKMPAFAFRRIFIFWQKLNWPSIEIFIGKVDIYHNFNWYLPPQKYGKSVATIFDTTAINHSKFHHPNTVQLDKIRFSRINKYTDLVIAISESAKKDFLKLYPKKRVEVIYPSTQGSFEKRIKKDKKFLKKYNLEEGYILSVGTNEPRKNLISLIKAYLELETNKKLVLVGGSGWKDEENNHLIKLNKDKIIQVGFVNEKELVQFYKYAFCFVYPSFYEGFGIPVLEALKIGLPVITSKTSSLPEVGGDSVLYIDPLDYKTIKNALLKLIKNKSLVFKLKEQSLIQTKKFNWEKSAKKLSRIYSSS